jgi:hypothetical protein
MLGKPDPVVGYIESVNVAHQEQRYQHILRRCEMKLDQLLALYHSSNFEWH